MQALFLYRSGPLLKNVILFKTPLPVGYVVNGDYGQDCTPLGPGDAVNPLESLAYCEDEAWWEHNDAAGKPSSRLLLLSCDPNRKSWNTVMGPLRDPSPKGALWVHKPSKKGEPEGKPQRITLKGYPENHDFHPLGLEAWPSYGGNASNLYVVNHARERTTIEQFTIHPSDPTVATHIRTLSSPYFVAPNALALTSPDSFYVSNDHLITRRWPIIGHVVPVLESVLGLPLAFVSHVTLNPPNSGESAIAKHEFAANFIPFPNGVSISSDGKTVAIASTSLAQIWFYDRDPATNALTKTSKVVTLPFCGDNIRFTPSLDNPDGPEELLVAGHPHFPSLVQLAKGLPAHSGSWVVSVVPKSNPEQSFEKNGKKFDGEASVSTSDYVSDGPTWSLKTLFQSDGSPGGVLSSSTGLRDPETGKLYVTGLYHPDGAVVCTPRK
ncbi:arylesterase [Coprinopsis cinerea okayama7|uniref:Arylesterase n=1 Tax=Coprinopsis cinerea (strain Okayama-7 / 130 / ATCC MYA-4618 / FGSC 9003) TaxID=240176 RepID=A8NU63_COPC7|nr:arylesterase [Coprinopsis cinerea okayama7\|eukprot:XP_001836385.2 arylesterase [Coprinopsis cinerea okayama7\